MHGRSAAVVVVLLLHRYAYAYGSAVEEGSSFHLPVTPPAVPESAEERREHYRAMEAKDLVRHRHMVEGSMRRSRQAWEVTTNNTTASSTFELPMRSALNVVNVGMYLVTVRIGTPPQAFSMALDTASDLTWLNCRLRRRKGKHPGRPHVAEQPKTVTTLSMDPEGGAPVEVKVVKNWYRPALSSSWRRYRCSEQDTCAVFPHNFCQSPNQTESCTYEQTYQDGTTTSGIYGREEATVELSGGRRAKISGLVLGCSTFEAGPNVEVHDGVLTLGNAIISFGTIAGMQFGGRFSFCLLPTTSPRNASSYLTFGPNPAIDDDGRMETKLVYNRDIPAFGACVTGIFVAGELLDIPPEVWDHTVVGGGLNLDTGTSLTGLVEPAYRAVTRALHRHLAHLERTELNGFDLCYKWTFAGDGVDPEHNVTIPKFVIEFEGGARLEPDAKSVILPEVVPGVACLAFRLLQLGPGVIGNVHMQEHVWEFDHLKEKLRFKKDKCHTHPLPSSSSATTPTPTH